MSHFLLISAILKVFLTKKEKNHKIKFFCHIFFGHMQLFHFIIFFSFRYGIPPKWPQHFFFTVFGQNLDQIQTKLSQIFAKLSGLAPNGPAR